MERKLTGLHVLLMFLGFFGLIFAVNFTMAYNAIATFPGLEVKNGYVASQNFDRELAAQLALGWDVSARLDGDELRISIRDKAGQPVRVKDIGGIFGRATETRDDQNPKFEFDGQDYVARVRVARGNWNMRLVAHAEDGTLFHQRIVLYVKEG